MLMDPKSPGYETGLIGYCIIKKILGYWVWYLGVFGLCYYLPVKFKLGFRYYYTIE
jgi:hypothetical protein